MKKISLSVVLLLSLSPGSLLAADVLANLADYFRNADQRAAQLLESGDAEAASALFKDSQWRGVGQYRAGNLEEAMKNFSLSDDVTALYNHGTTAAQAGDYNQAVDSLTAALELAPDDEQIKQNLEIARELKKLSDQNQQQQSDDQSDQQESGDDSEEQSGDEGEQSSDEPQSDENQSTDSQQQSGEPDSQQQDNSNDPDSAEDLENLREQMQQSQAESADDENEGSEEQESPASTSVSEDDQATEQWLRRIPDDGSQLLRNKIRLNHLIEYPDVDDMQENW